MPIDDPGSTSATAGLVIGIVVVVLLVVAGGMFLLIRKKRFAAENRPTDHPQLDRARMYSNPVFEPDDNAGAVPATTPSNAAGGVYAEPVLLESGPDEGSRLFAQQLDTYAEISPPPTPTRSLLSSSSANNHIRAAAEQTEDPQCTMRPAPHKVTIWPRPVLQKGLRCMPALAASVLPHGITNYDLASTGAADDTYTVSGGVSLNVCVRVFSLKWEFMVGLCAKCLFTHGAKMAMPPHRHLPV